MILKIHLFFNAEAECSNKGKELEHAHFAVECETLEIVHKRKLPYLEAKGYKEEGANTLAVSLKCLVLKDVLIFCHILGGVIVPKVLHITYQISHSYIELFIILYFLPLLL